MARFTQPSTGGGGGGDLPQALGQQDSPYFDKIYTTHNSDGTNVYIGDDVVIGDVDISNFMSVQGQQDSTLGGIIFGSGMSNRIYTDGSGLVLEANNGDMNLYMDGTAYIGDSDPGHRIITQNDLTNIPSTFAYGAFHDETSFGPYAANTEHSFSYQTTDMSHDIHIGGINNDQIVMDRDGKFNIAFSAQFHQISSAGNVFIWLAKNGTAIPWTNSKILVTANTPEVIAAWNFFVDAVAGDYFEIRWSSTSNQTQVFAITGLTGTKPNVPSMIVTVNQVG